MYKDFAVFMCWGTHAKHATSRQAITDVQTVFQKSKNKFVTRIINKVNDTSACVCGE